jgi:hypothetical protein
MSALETQVGGSHYKDMPIQPMEFSMANGLDACQHTIIKYVTRFRQKGGIQDLEKAQHVLAMLIEFERKATPQNPANDNLLPPHTTAKAMAMVSGRCAAREIAALCEACAATTSGTCLAATRGEVVR